MSNDSSPVLSVGWLDMSPCSSRSDGADGCAANAELLSEFDRAAVRSTNVNHIGSGELCCVSSFTAGISLLSVTVCDVRSMRTPSKVLLVHARGLIAEMLGDFSMDSGSLLQNEAMDSGFSSFELE